MLLRKKKLLEEFVELLKKYSPTGKEEEAIKYVAKLANNYGFDEVFVDEVGNLHAIYGKGPVELALIPHIDTVPGNIPVKICGNKVFGRGAVDAKGPLYAMLIGASLVKREVEDNVKIHFIAEVGEEGDSRGARFLISKNFKPNSIIIGEPSSTTGVVIAYRGSIHLKIKCYSEGGHPASPKIKPSAFEKFMMLMRELLTKAPGTEYDVPQARVTFIRAGEAPNKLPEELQAFIDIRVPFKNTKWNVDFEKFLNEIKNIVTRNLCEFEILGSTRPVKVSSNSKVVRAVMRAIIRNGRKPVLVRKYGSSDMNLFYNIVKDVVAYGPGDSTLSHSLNEHIIVEDLLFGIKTYAQAIREYVNLK